MPTSLTFAPLVHVSLQASLHFAESNQACVDSVPWQRLSKRATVHTGDQVRIFESTVFSIGQCVDVTYHTRLWA